MSYTSINMKIVVFYANTFKKNSVRIYVLLARALLTLPRAAIEWLKVATIVSAFQHLQGHSQAYTYRTANRDTLSLKWLFIGQKYL